MVLDTQEAVDGAERCRGVLTADELLLLEDLFTRRLNKGPGTRLVGDPALLQLLCDGGNIDGIARAKLGPDVRPVRAVLFDKRQNANWSLGWHQDRTIAVREKVDCDGFGPWTRKAGITHVEPPFDYVERMVTLRVHLDPVESDNGPLMIALGSHRIGRIPIEQVDDVARRVGRFVCLADSGDVWVYPTAILHASDAVRTSKRRRVLQVDYAAVPLPGGLEWLGV